MTAIGPQSANFTTTRPATNAVVSGGTDTWFTDCSAAGATDGTVIDASFLNVLVAQLRTAITTAGVTLDDTDDSMLYTAIQSVANTAAAAAYTASGGIALTGTDFALDLGTGTRANLAFGGIDTVADEIGIHDATDTTVKETTPYEIVKAVLQNNVTATFDDVNGRIDGIGGGTSITVTVAGIAPAAPADGDYWIDTANDNEVNVYLNAAWQRIDSVEATVAAAAPASASDGDLFVDTANANRVSVWANGGFQAISATVITVAAAAPATPAPGDIFVDTGNENRTFLYADTGGGAAFVDVTAPTFTPAAVAPATPRVGDFWFDTGGSLLFIRANDGATDFWVQIS